MKRPLIFNLVPIGATLPSIKKMIISIAINTRNRLYNYANFNFDLHVFGMIQQRCSFVKPHAKQEVLIEIIH